RKDRRSRLSSSSNSCRQVRHPFSRCEKVSRRFVRQGCTPEPIPRVSPDHLRGKRGLRDTRCPPYQGAHVGLSSDLDKTGRGRGHLGHPTPVFRLFYTEKIFSLETVIPLTVCVSLKCLRCPKCLFNSAIRVIGAGHLLDTLGHMATQRGAAR